MPYRSIADLPHDVKVAHKTPHARRVFMEAFNNAAASGKYPESDLFRIAHAAADKVTARKRKPKAPVVHEPETVNLRRYVHSPEF